MLLLITVYSCTRSTRIQYESVSSADTTEGYQKFLRKNPESSFTEDAKDKLYRAAYIQTIEKNTAEAYDEYIRKYPDSPYLDDLIKQKENTLIYAVFEEVKEQNTLQGYINFVTKYPEHDLAKEATKSILNIQLNLTEKPSSNSIDGVDIRKLTLEQISQLTPEQIERLIKNLQQQPPKSASRTFPVAQPPSVQLGELTANAPIFFPPETGFIEAPTAANPKKTIPSKRADLQTTQPQFQAKATIPELQPQNRVEAQITEPKPQAEAKIGKTKPQTKAQITDIEGQTSPEKYSDLVDDTIVSFRTPNTTDKILYGKAFGSSRAPRVIHKEFSFFIKTLQRTSQYVEIKASFHNLNKIEKEFVFSRINLVNSQGKRVKPVRVAGGGWKVLSNGAVQTKAFGNERSEFIILFPSLNLFRNDSYKLYVTVNNKNYLIQI